MEKVQQRQAPAPAPFRQAAVTVGMQLAERFLVARHEVVDRKRLAAMLAVAFEQGAELGAGMRRRQAGGRR